MINSFSLIQWTVGELLEVYEQEGDTHNCGCPPEGKKRPPPQISLNIKTNDHTHASRRYEKVYYSHNGIFCKSRAWLSFHGD